MGYLRYSELMKCDVMKDPCFIEYRNSVIRLSDGDPIKQIYFAVIDLLTGKSGAINKRLAQYVPAKIKRYLDEDEEMSCSDFIYCLVLPLKEGIPGMWSYLRKLLDRPGVCKGIPEMCEALESVYYGTKNEDIADALLRVLQATVDKGIHDKSTIIELPTLYKVPPKRDYGRYFCISARKEEPPHRGLMKNQAPFFMLKIRR